MALADVPAEISRQEVADFIAKLGFSLNDIPADCAIHFGYQQIRFRVWAKDSKGVPYVDNGLDKPATHEVSIRIAGPPVKGTATLKDAAEAAAKSELSLGEALRLLADQIIKEQ